ncbi:Acyl-CoA dehydrogenase, N-terminal domain/Acyl-CoA dehydrogenase, middle domain/Acyl-CoA dehydrogenase, C-terminal domain containing protein, putative [Angomonas deanei]|uniref:Acyl-CoA dehydrogenase, N-terminal domain/Acyl-CoA dehydrogenase, middle domain/Acyl-CoA dehydrogenase, C-terminal domain containing protein, putative n=1 Tax=Angomonas deanei TaxID=59799 RepID=A0A7G2CCP1_9TRYP|nr:Acyl-CoA dehydrogenase, N-terminal domain/Acyl-CoA dehydrogenase, middle domain/Acyl-CoA dehydrogenase, C-terminal domain containing protein, putative [Angomonas deanei]
MYRHTSVKLIRSYVPLLQKKAASDNFFGGTSPTQEDPNGLSFGLSPQQVQFQQLARQFSKDRIIPNAAKYDASMAYPHDLFQEAHALGLLNLHVPEQYGGMQAKVLDVLIVGEELAYGCSGIGTALQGNDLPSTPLLVAGTAAQCRKYLGRLVEAPLQAAYCVTEPGGGSDVSGMKTTARKQGDKWILNGRKMWITNGGVADWFFVLAKCDEGFIALIVDGDSPGLTREKKEVMLGQRCSDTRGITFEDVAVPEENVIGAVGKGFHVAMKAFDYTRPPIAIGAVGVARRATDEAARYARERQSMGKPIAEHQGVGFLLAEMAAGVEAGRLLAYRSGWEIDQGRPNTYFASVAKMKAAQHCEFCTTNAIQIFGGNGYSTGYPVEKLFRDAKIFSIYEGTTEIQHMVISRFVTGMRC